MPKTSYKCVMTTVGGEPQAVSMADAIIKARLAACVQFWPIRSTYWWDGKIENGHEFVVVCKTRSALATGLRTFIKTHHAYETPEIIVTPIESGCPSYLAWVTAETSQPRLTFSPPATRRRSSRNDGKS